MAWLMIAGLPAGSVIAVDSAHAQANRRVKPTNPHLKPRTGHGPVRSIRSPGNTAQRTRLGFKPDTIGGNHPPRNWFGARIGIGFRPEVIAPANDQRTPRRIGFFTRGQASRAPVIISGPDSILPLFGSRRTIGFKQAIVPDDPTPNDVPGMFGMRRLIGYAGGYVANKPKLILPEAPSLMLPPGANIPAPERVIVKGFQPSAHR
ncbi:MAG: hypothetical protein IPL79_17780 [Myxococcales bacterium]|nr:hypothetical protein [Myxococcales bacterium]